MELYNEMTDLNLTEQIHDESVTTPVTAATESETPAETEPDTETPVPVPADLLDDDPDDTPPAAPAAVEEPAPAPARRRAASSAPILTIDSRGSVESEDAREAAAWHEIHNAYRTRRILSGHLGGIEQTAGGKTVATMEYNSFRIAIPMKEMMIQLGDTTGQSASAVTLRQNKLLGNMLGAEIDFVVRGIDSGSRSVVASRRDAMLRKRQLFFLAPGPGGHPRIEAGRIVQARVIAVAEKTVRVEVFGVETSILARDLAWDYKSPNTELLQYLLLQRGMNPFVSATDYAVCYESHTDISAEEIQNEVSGLNLSERLGFPLRPREVLEIDDGLHPYFFHLDDELRLHCIPFRKEDCSRNTLTGFSAKEVVQWRE